MKGFSPQKGNRKLVFLERTFRLHLKTLTFLNVVLFKKELHILTFGKVMRHAILFLHHIRILFQNVIYFAARCWQISSKQRYIISSKLYILQHQAQRWSGGLFGSDRQWIIFRNTVGKVLVSYAYVAVSIESQLKIKAGVSCSKFESINTI